MSNKYMRYSNLYNNTNNNNNNKQVEIPPTTIIIQDKSDAASIYSIFHSILSIIAIYLSVRCNQKINYTSIVIAIFFPYLYIIYSIIMHNGICPT